MTNSRVAIMVLATVLIGAPVVAPRSHTVEAFPTQCFAGYLLSGYDESDNLVAELANSNNWHVENDNMCIFYGIVWGQNWAAAACSAHGLARWELYQGTWNRWDGGSGTLPDQSGSC